MSEGFESIEPVDPARIPEPEPAPRPTLESRPARTPPPPDRPLFPWIVSGIGILTLLGAIFLTRGGQGPASEPAPAAAPTPAEETPAPAPATATRDDLDSLKAELQTRIDALAKSVDELPKPEPAPDLKPIEEKVAALAPLTEMAPTLNAKLLEVQDELAAVKADLKAVADRVETMKETAAPAAAESTTTPMPAPSEPEAEKPRLAGDEIQAVLAQFKQNQFQPANDELAKLRDQYPSDARVWYLSALANGFATGTWTGETTQLVTKAVELEKAGTPGREAIDAALTGLNPSATQWVNFYRQQAR
jgi:TolA-binding protein